MALLPVVILRDCARDCLVQTLALWMSVPLPAPLITTECYHVTLVGVNGLSDTGGREALSWESGAGWHKTVVALRHQQQRCVGITSKLVD